MQSANGGHDGRYLPSSMDYTGMSHHPHHPHHHLGSDPHSLHYSLPPSAMSVGGHQPHHQLGSKRLSDMDMMGGNISSDEDGSMDIKPSLSERGTGRGAPIKAGSEGPPTGKKTKGRVKIKMEFIDNKLRRYTTFSKRKTGIMKKAYELSTLTGTQVMLLVASETGHVYTFATRKLQPMITSDAGKALIQTCLNSPDPPPTVSTSDQRMSVSGYEETELTYNVADSEQQEKVRQMMYNSHYSPAAALAAAAHHSHNLFPPSGGPGGHLPPTHSGGMNISSSMSPFPGHPAPSPSPSHHPPPHSYSLSPSLSHSPGPGSQQHLVSSHSPPFLSHGQHPSSR